MSAPVPPSVEHLACPACAGRVAFVEPGEGGELVCAGCDAAYPVLCGVPILVADPASYVAEHRSAILAALARHDLATPESVAQVLSWAQLAGRVPEALFDEDATRMERDTGPSPRPETDDEGFLTFYDRANARSLASRLLALHRGGLGRTVEIGAGVGASSVELAAASESLLLVDLSFSALLDALAHTAESSDGSRAAVMDAERLALRAGAFDAVVALNVIDVLADPLALIEGAGEALTRRGALLLSTPDPALGMIDGPSSVLAEAASELGFDVAGRVESAPWLRVHGPREMQVFFVHLLALAKR